MHTQAVIHSIENHSALQIAGLDKDERLKAVRERLLQLSGMLELAQRIAIDPVLLRFLKAHREHLTDELAGR